MKMFAGVLIGLAIGSLPSVAADVTVFDTLSAHCGKAYKGEVVRYNESDDAWRSAELILHIRDCSDHEIKMPLHVGENRSRILSVTKTAEGLRLKHDHRHADGHPDAVTLYGGDTVRGADLSAQSVAFLVDDFSIKMFKENGLTASVTNVWHMGAEEGSFTYRLTRKNRDFMINFDLSKPVQIPPAAWDKLGH